MAVMFMGKQSKRPNHTDRSHPGHAGQLERPLLPGPTSEHSHRYDPRMSWSVSLLPVNVDVSCSFVADLDRVEPPFV